VAKRFLRRKTFAKTINDVFQTDLAAGFELSKNKWGGVDICLFIVIVITHRQFSIINNGGGLKLTPPGYPRASFLGGLSKQLGGGFNPPNPPAIQTLPGRYEKSGIVQPRLFVHTHVHRRLFPLRVRRAGQRQTRTHRIGGIREDIADRTPNMLQTDRGLEFLNAQAQEVFHKNNVHHYYSLNDDIKASLVERFNRTLKSRLYWYMTHHHTNRCMDRHIRQHREII
jgi:hypothetical protein